MHGLPRIEMNPFVIAGKKPGSYQANDPSAMNPLQTICALSFGKNLREVDSRLV
jgi:hypothetical protein